MKYGNVCHCVVAQVAPDSQGTRIVRANGEAPFKRSLPYIKKREMLQSEYVSLLLQKRLSNVVF